MPGYVDNPIPTGAVVLIFVGALLAGGLLIAFVEAILARKDKGTIRHDS